MRLLIAFAWLVLILIVIVFVVLNSVHISFNYYLGQVDIYLPLLLFLFLLSGVLLGIVAMLPYLWRRHRRERHWRRQCREMEGELINLRQIPIQDSDK